ncbi:MAG: sulfur carrier protein ThiS [bacterium]
MGKLKVTINGKETEIAENFTITNLLEDLKVTGSMFVVEKNLEIVPKENFHVKINDGDKLEIVGFFGGG